MNPPYEEKTLLGQKKGIPSQGLSLGGLLVIDPQYRNLIQNQRRKELRLEVGRPLFGMPRGECPLFEQAGHTKKRMAEAAAKDYSGACPGLGRCEPQLRQ